MRLLHYNDDGEFSLTEFFDNMPPYAILSHTWGPEEVSFKDIIEKTGTSKASFEKIQFCGEQARRDGLHYFWVDTCCIDKSSSAELSEAINSMFRWYHEAVKCYVFLSDVESPPELYIRDSKWFKRGWTLQELLAPRCVEFFSKDRDFVGDKVSLERIICKVTRISREALQGRPLADFTVAERLLWMERRKTTRQEDMAYSLLGIFDISMPLIYGEGREKAFNRLLEEIKKYVKGFEQELEKEQEPERERELERGQHGIVYYKCP